jgi:hypothetical protein
VCEGYLKTACSEKNSDNRRGGGINRGIEEDVIICTLEAATVLS